MQACDCEEKQDFPLIDCPNGFHLCYVCCTNVAGGTSRWSWEACALCLAANNSLRAKGERHLDLGRHSLMNGISGKLSQRKNAKDKSIESILMFAIRMRALHESSSKRTENLFRAVPAWQYLNQVPLSAWEKKITSIRGTWALEDAERQISKIMIEIDDKVCGF